MGSRAQTTPTTSAIGDRIDSVIGLMRQGALAQAQALCEEILATTPECFDALQLLGAIAAGTGRPEIALAFIDRALALRTDNARAYYNRGSILRDLNRLDEALACHDLAIAIEPDYAEAHNNRGFLLMELRRPDEALASYERAISLRPDYANAHNHRGLALQELWRLDEALASYELSIALKPDHARAHLNRGLLRLLVGDYASGWASYEWRWKVPDWVERPRAYPQPLWQGDADLRGKRILLWAEQGFGDSIQFCRYVTQVATLGAVVILEAPAALAPLLKPLGGVAEFVAKGDVLPPFDYHCPLLSLPLALGKSSDSPSGKPYFAAPPERIAASRTTLGASPRPRVGLAWCGSTWHKNDSNRSISLAKFAQGLITGVDYIQLQKDVRAADRAWLDQHPEIRSFDVQVNDFGDTAALIETMDLVITVDTSIAHLAGALGKEVWVLLAFAPDWRWLLDRSDSPWYDSATLFRQPAPGDWDGVLAAVRQALESRFSPCDDPPPGAPPAPLDSPAAPSIDSLASAFARCRAGDTATAAVMCRGVLATDPQCFDALHLLGVIDASAGRFDAALDWLDRALSIDPRHADARRNRQSAASQFAAERIRAGLAAHRRGDLSGAERIYESVLIRDPENFDALQLLGALAVQVRQPLRGLALLDRAIALKPDSFDAHTNRGIALTELKRFDEAIACHSRALAIRPESGDALFNRATLHLLLGDYARGLPGYEWRRKRESRNRKPRSVDKPLWSGEQGLTGKRILLYAEQGFGDSIQFCRFVPRVAALGANVILELPAALASLFACLKGVAQITRTGEAPPPFDFHCPLPSLPLAFKTTLHSLSGRPYLVAPPDSVAGWGKLLGKAARPRVGLAWSGNANVGNDYKRAIPLSRLSQALPQGIDYVQLQKGVRTDDQACLARLPEIRSFEAQVKDFGDTAALIDALDLVISVDTSVAHLAGALGKEVWLLLPHVPDWRWLLDRSDSPWYDSASLFRQPAPDDWDSVLVAVGQALAERFSLHLGNLPSRPSLHPQ